MIWAKDRGILAKIMGLAVFFLCFGLPTQAQRQQAINNQRDIQLELGLAGNIVTGHWNPLRISMRDQPASTLIIRMDVGNLREGERWLEYRADLAAGSGRFTFEDDIFIPAWRSLVWQVRSQETTATTGTTARTSTIFMTGSLSPQNRQDEKLDLVISSEAGRYPALLGAGTRVIEIEAQDLPLRSAAYDGVARLLIVDSLAEPISGKALLAAAVAGTQVGIRDNPNNAATLEPLQGIMPHAAQPLGAGWLLRLESANDWQQPLDKEAFYAQIQQLYPLEFSRPMAASVVAIAIFIYGLLVFIMLRWLGELGLLSAWLLALLLTPLSLLWLSNNRSNRQQQHSIRIEAGGLAQQQLYSEIFNLKASSLHLPQAYVPKVIEGEATWLWRDNATLLENEAGSYLSLRGRPSLERADKTETDIVETDTTDVATEDISDSFTNLPTNSRVLREGNDIRLILSNP